MMRNFTPAPQASRRGKCRFTKAGVEYIDFKDVDTLKRYLNEQGKIMPRRITGTSAHHQRQLNVAIKRARHLSLIPFVADNLR